MEIPDIPEQGLPEVPELNLFAYDSGWVSRLRERVGLASEALDLAAEGQSVPSKLRPSRYRDGLARLDAQKTKALRSWLERYLAGLSRAARKSE